jgi:hypothetical protein
VTNQRRSKNQGNGKEGKVMNDKCDELAEAMAQRVRRGAALKAFGIGLGIIMLTLMTFTPVFGGNRSGTFRYTAKLVPAGDERRASGVVNMTVKHGTGSGSYNGSVSCKGLTPGAKYQLLASNNVGAFVFGVRVAAKLGTVEFGFSGMYGDYQGFPSRFEVYRIEATGSVLVLSGGIQ